MRLTSPSATLQRPTGRWPAVGLACVLALAILAQAPATPASAGALQSPLISPSGARPSISATLEQCVTAEAQSERSATFAGEMTAVAGTARMQMRIDVLERMPGEASYRSVSAAGLGAWRASAPGVKVYKFLSKVTNLSAPAAYRGAVWFRWLNAKGRLVKTAELRTPRCEQPAPPSPTSSPTGASPPSTTG